MGSIIKQFLSHDEIIDSNTYNRLNELNKQTVAGLEKSVVFAKKDLLLFFRQQQISTPNPKRLADLLIDLWLRSRQALDLVMAPNHSAERKRLNTAIDAATILINQLQELKQSSLMIDLLNLDLKLEIDYDALIQANQEFINHAKLAIRQNFERGKSPLSIDKIKELIIFTLFYVGEELLRLKQSGKPSPLYQLIKIIVNINDSSHGAWLADDKISTYYTKYCEKISNSIHDPIEGERLGVKYSITPHNNGWVFVAGTDSETIERFIEDDIKAGVISLIKFMYALKIPDHAITMFIFDTKTLLEIIQLLH